MDIIGMSISDAKSRGANEETQWEITFTDGITLVGTLTPLHHGYRLNRFQSYPAYFDASKVVRLLPQNY